MKPPPPMFPAAGNVTSSAKPVATAASTALPPFWRISMPASLARRLLLAIIACCASVARPPASNRHPLGNDAARVGRGAAGGATAGAGAGAFAGAGFVCVHDAANAPSTTTTNDLRFAERRMLTSCSEMACQCLAAMDKLAAVTAVRRSFLLVSSMPDLDPRLTERRNPRTASIDLASPLEIVDLIQAEDRTVPEAVASQREAIARAISLVEQAFRAGGRLFYVGAGTSGRLGVLDASECPPTFGTDPEMVQGIIAGGLDALVRSQEGAEDVAADGAAAMDARGVGRHDVVIGIAASGTTPYVRGALERAKERGACTVIVSCSPPPADVVTRADVAILPITGPEVVTGSTRLKAGTATKLVLNTITTGAMIRIGKTYGNLMVDLRAMSQKLVDRGERILIEVTG